MSEVAHGLPRKTGAKSQASDNVCSVNFESVGRTTESVRPCAESAGRVRLPRVAWRGQASIVDRFWARVNKNGPVHPDLGTACWVWDGCVVARYGQISLGHPSTPGAKRWKTHRFAWELHHGAVPDHLRVCHKCDNPLCVRPDHLFLGTQKENVHDSIRKNRRNSFGHQKLTPDDVRIIRAQAARGILQKDVAAAFGISRNHVSSIVHRTSWAHLPSASPHAAATAGVERGATASPSARRASSPVWSSRESVAAGGRRG